MNFGGDRKRIAILGGLVLVGVYVLWSNFSSSSGTSEPAVRTVSTPVQQPAMPADVERVKDRRAGRSRPTDWTPGVSGKPLDPLQVDPTLRLDLLAKLQQVDVNGAQRNLFQFGEAAPAPVDSKPLPKVAGIHMGKGPGGPVPGGPAGAPPKPSAPPITLKYYGYTNPRSSPRKKAFFLDGDEIIVATEGDLMKKRYRLVRIGVNSATVEDTQFNNNEQILPLIEDGLNG